MPSGQDATKAERFAEFLRRLGAAPTAASQDEAYRQFCDILNGVEDDMTSIPYDASQWMVDGRMYPPQDDRKKPVAGRPDVVLYQSRAHKTLIADNGAIEIRERSGRLVFAKPGNDGSFI
jgi:hypothetical protein